MAVQSRVNYIAQQRIDLPDFLALESYTAYDFRTITTFFTGIDRAYVIRGFEVVAKSGLSVDVKVADSLVFNPKDNNGAFYSGLSSDNDLSVSLPGEQNNIYVEAVFSNKTQTPVNRGVWDSVALLGQEAKGKEFTTTIDVQNVITLEISVNTVGFSEGAIPLFKARTSASSILEFTDCRPMMFRLGTGGSTPNPLRKYEWSTGRTEPVDSGSGVGNEINSPWRSQDSTGAVNDKAFKSLKDILDALMTAIAEIRGSAIWYLSGGGTTGPVSGISLNQLFFDTIGHSIQPSKNVAFKWVNDGGFKLIGEGLIPANGSTGLYHNGLIKWKANNSKLEWHLGGSFSSAYSRNYSTSGLRFSSPSPDDSGNIYLYLEREVAKGSGDPVKWKDTTGDPGSSFVEEKSVSGALGDFTGIALGDYIRKESEGYSRYYKVVRMTDGTTIYDNADPNEENQIADSSIILLELEDTIIGDASTEPLRYFRSRYSSSDLVADTDITSNGYIYQDTSYYWLGRREGDLFILRDYGTMQEGEEASIMDVVFAHGKKGGSGNPLVLEHKKEARYNDTDGYSLKTGSGSLINIYKQKRDNTVETPTAGSDNSGSLLEYYINNPAGILSVGQSLWVRLSDSTGGELTAGSVTNDTDDEDNTDLITNKYEIRDAADAPVDSFDNIDVFLLARRVDINGQDCIVFCDGSILTDFGQLVSTNLDVSGELRLNDYGDTSIPYLANDGSKEVLHDNSQLFYDGTTFGVRTLRINDNDISQNIPDDINILSNLGSHTAYLGEANSTIIVNGDLQVLGTTFASQTENVISEDKLITLGIGAIASANYNGGIEVADNTLTPDSADALTGNSEITLTYTSAPSYSIGDYIGVYTDNDIGGITSGQISGQYLIVATASAPGEASLSGLVLTVYTRGTATSDESITTGVPKSYKSPWSFKISGSDGSITGITSWAFQVKGITTKPTITPVEDYGIVATSHSANMAESRIPFVGDDGSGPAGADTTLNYSSFLRWNDSIKLLYVDGDLQVQDIIPQGNNLYSIGQNGLVFKQLFLGPLGVMIGDGDITWNIADQALDTSVKFQSTKAFQSDLGFDHQEYATLTFPTPTPVSGYIRTFARDGLIWQQQADGNQKLLTNINGNVYSEIVDIVSVPSGNNESAPLNIELGENVIGSTTNGSDVVTININSHGLSTGNEVFIRTLYDIGGIPYKDISGDFTVTKIDDNNISIQAGSSATSDDSGYIYKVVEPATQSIPQDTISLIGITLSASTTNGSDVVVVNAENHGLSTGNNITVITTADIGGIISDDLSGTFTITKIDDNSFSYQASNIATSDDSGYLDKITSQRLRYYTVGEKELEVYLNGELQIKGIHWRESGFDNTQSSQIIWLRNIDLKDSVEYRIDSNGGKIVFNQAGGGGSLQESYNLGNIINVSAGIPVTINGTGKVLSITGDMYISGVIDPKGIVFTAESSNPLQSDQNGLWVNTSNQLIFSRDSVADINITEDLLYRDGSKTLTGNLNTDNNKIINLKDIELSQQASDPVTASGYGIYVNDSGDLIYKADTASLNITTELFKRDGSLAATGDWNLDSNKITNLPEALTDSEPIRKLEFDTVITGINSSIGGIVTSLDDYLLRDGTSAMTGNLNTDNNKIINLKDIELSQQASDPVTASGYGIYVNDSGDLIYKADTASLNITTELFKRDGSLAATGDWNLDSNRIINIADPVDNNDAANKQYVLDKARYFADYISVTNNTGSDIPANYIVRISDTDEIDIANASAIASSEGSVGVTTSIITNGSSGYVQISGRIQISGSSYTPGQLVWLDPSNAGQGTSTKPSTNGNVRYSLGVAISSTDVVLKPRLDGINANIYEESYNIPSPTSAGTNITLPLDSRNSNSTKSYIPGSGALQVFLNEVKLRLNEHYSEISSTQIQTLIDLDDTDVLQFRIGNEQPIFLVSTGGAGSQSLQDTYNIGRTITITSGAPVVFNGPVGEKIAVFNGDIDVTGVIDPKGITLTRQSSNPLPAGMDGLWINNSGDVIQQKNGEPDINITEVVVNTSTPRKLCIPMINNTGSSIAKFQIVSVNRTTGEIQPTDVSSQDHSIDAFGVTLEIINNGESGDIVTQGRIENITGLDYGTVFVSKTGLLTNNYPTVGSDGFVSGDHAIKVGVIIKNNNEPTQKDLIVNIDLVSQL